MGSGREAVYDEIGGGYTAGRREDPRIADAICKALGDAASVVNVGAGAGSYEPGDRSVVAVEPSATMIFQRPLGAAPAVRRFAEELPFTDAEFVYEYFPATHRLIAARETPLGEISEVLGSSRASRSRSER